MFVELVVKGPAQESLLDGDLVFGFEQHYN